MTMTQCRSDCGCLQDADGLIEDARQTLTERLVRVEAHLAGEKRSRETHVAEMQRFADPLGKLEDRFSDDADELFKKLTKEHERLETRFIDKSREHGTRIEAVHSEASRRIGRLEERQREHGLKQDAECSEMHAKLQASAEGQPAGNQRLESRLERARARIAALEARPPVLPLLSSRALLSAHSTHCHTTTSLCGNVGCGRAAGGLQARTRLLSTTPRAHAEHVPGALRHAVEQRGGDAGAAQGPV